MHNKAIMVSIVCKEKEKHVLLGLFTVVFLLIAY